MTTTQTAAYDAMRAALVIFLAERTAEAADAYKAASKAYIATMPRWRGFLKSIQGIRP